MFQTLESSKQILKQCLLQNPHLSDKQFHMVMELYGIGMVSRDGRHEHMHEFLEDLFVLAKTKATLQVLSEVRMKLSFHCKQECNIDRKCDGDLQKVEDTNDVAKQAVAQLIQRYMYHQYKNSGIKKTNLDKKYTYMYLLLVECDGCIASYGPSVFP